MLRTSFRFRPAAALATLLLLTLPAAAQSPAVHPTTKILAIGKLAPAATAKERRAIIPQEVRDTLQLYLRGKIDQWYSQQDGSGVVFLLNVSSAQEAHALLEALPLGQAKMMTFELIPLGPLAPLGLLANTK